MSHEDIPFVIITGMHRSGTSFLARALNLSGVYLGELESLATNDWSYHFDNLRGHWENKKLIDLSEKTLSKNNSTWDNFSEKIVCDEEIGKEIKGEIQELESKTSLIPGFKDPRILLFLDSWAKYLPENLVIVGIFRDPLKVAESLKIRNDFSYEKSLDLWTKYNQKLLEVLEKYDGFLLNFDWPKEKLLTEISKISSKLGICKTIDLTQWYTEELFHADKKYKTDFILSDEIKQIYQLLKKRSEKNNLVKIQINYSEEQRLRITDELLQNIQKHGDYFRKVNEKNLNEISNLKSLADEKLTKSILSEIEFNSKKIAELETDKREKDRKIAELETDKREKDQELVELEVDKREKDRMIAEIETDKREKDRKIVELETVKNSTQYKMGKYAIEYLDKKFPPNSVIGKIIRKFLKKIFKNHISLAGQFTPFEYQYKFESGINEEFALQQIRLLDHKPKISIIMPVYNSNVEFLKDAINSVENQYYSNWQLCICDDGSTKNEIRKILESYAIDKKINIIFSKSNNGISVASNKALEIAEGEYVVLLDHDDQLSKHALLEIVKAINNDKELEFIYSDEDKISGNNHVEPFFKPDWSPDLFFSYNYPIHVSVFKTKILKEIGGFRKEFDESQDYDLILRYLEKINHIHHIPKVLYSWRKSVGSTALAPSEKKSAFEAGRRALNEALRRRQIDGSCEEGVQKFTYRIRYKIKGTPLISIIIPTRDLNNLKVCIQSLFEKTTYKNFEIIIMDNSRDDRIKYYCKKFHGIKLIKVTTREFNFSKINNDGVKQSRGEYIIFLNDDTKIITPEWIENLLEHAQREEIGITGCKLLYENDLVQHAGTIIGIQGHAGNYGMINKNEGGYFSFAKITRNCSAVTAACMMIRREVFDQLGGLDEEMKRSWQDVDLCIRAIKSGKLIVYTPYSVLYHFEGFTRGSIDTTPDELSARRIFFQKNKDFIEKGDPFYNSNLSLTRPYQFRKRWVEPIQILYDIYEGRKDLQLNFPNDNNNKFRQMIDWAVTHGIIADSHKEFLKNHYDYYFDNCSKQAKPLAKKIRIYLKNPKLQNDFPEVKSGDYDNFLEFVDKSLN